MKTLQDLIDEYNAKAAKPIKSWKQKREVLEQRIEKLTSAPAETIPAITQENPMASKKTPAKKTTKVAKTAKPKAEGTSRTGIGAFVAEQLGKGKTTREIFDAAEAKGFGSTYGSVASLVSVLKKKG